MPGETTIDADGKTLASNFNRFQRARYFADAIEYDVVPHSLHEIAQNRERLNLLALVGKQFPIDPETMATKFDIPNWGSLDGSTISSRERRANSSSAEQQAAMSSRGELMRLSRIQPVSSS